MIRVILAIVITLLASNAFAAPPPEALVATLKSQTGFDGTTNKFFCHRTYRSNGTWQLSGGNAGGGGDDYAESDQDPNDRTLCGGQFGSDPRIGIFSTTAFPPTVGGATTINGITNMMTTTALDTIAHTGFMLHCPNNNPNTPPGTAPCYEQIPTGRMGWRFYMFNSVSTTCECAKRIDVAGYWSDGGCDFIPKGHAVGEIYQGDGTGPAGLTSDKFLNKWWRVEVYQDWPIEITTYSESFWTDLSTNTTYTRRAFADPANSIQTFTDQLDFIHTYRDGRSCIDNGPTAPIACQGQPVGPCVNGNLYLIVARNLAPTERIAPAIEVESGVIPQPPTAPCCLSVVEAARRLWRLLGGYWIDTTKLNRLVVLK